MITVLHQGAGFTIAASDEANTCVPYSEADHGQGERNHGYLDLRDNPERVQQIPEAQKTAGLAAFLEAISTSPTIQSTTCEAAVFSPVGDRELFQGGSFINVMFRDEEQMKDPGALEALALYLLQGVQPTDEHQIGFEMVIEPLKHYFGASGCFTLEVKAIGFGTTEEEAWASLDHCLLALRDSLVRDRLIGSG